MLLEWPSLSEIEPWVTTVSICDIQTGFKRITAVYVTNVHCHNVTISTSPVKYSAGPKQTCRSDLEGEERSS
jgi:hypothetical protein